MQQSDDNRLARHRVLVIDDEHAVRSVLARWFGRQGWDVDLAGDGDAAIALLTPGDPDACTSYTLLICDLRMPACSGLELFEWLRQHRPELCEHLVFSSGDVRDPAVATQLEDFGCPVLEKPFELPELARVVALASSAHARAA